MKKLAALIALAATLSTTPAWAAIETVPLSVHGMTCAACPITVRAALKRVPGVEKVDIEAGQKRVTVAYDDSKTDSQALTRATENAGYPSSVVPH